MGSFLLPAIILAAMIIAIAMISRATDSAEDYDERQELVRLKGYRTAFFTLIFLVMAVIFLSSSGLSLFSHIPASLMLWAALFASMTVFDLICIRNDAFSGVHGRSIKGSIAFCFLLGIPDLITAILNILGHGAMEEGMVSESVGIDLLFGIALVFNGLCLLIHLLHQRKEASEEE